MISLLFLGTCFGIDFVMIVGIDFSFEICNFRHKSGNKVSRPSRANEGWRPGADLRFFVGSPLSIL